MPTQPAGTGETPEEPAAVSEAVRRFVRKHISSVGQLEVLLLLARDCTRGWQADGVGRELYTHPKAAATWLADLSLRGLLTADPGPPLTYAFATGDPDVVEAVGLLARLFRERPVTVISLVHAGR